MNRTKIEWAGTEFRPLPNMPLYFASSDGRVLSLKKGAARILKPIAAPDGHLYVFVYVEGEMRKLWLHRAVLLAWVGEPEQGQEARHLDDSPAHNVLSNLAWGTRTENVADKRRNGGLPVGEKSGTHKLTEGDVRHIRSLRGSRTLRSLAVEYGVSHTCIRRAMLGINWTYMEVAQA